MIELDTEVAEVLERRLFKKKKLLQRITQK